MPPWDLAVGLLVLVVLLPPVLFLEGLLFLWIMVRGRDLLQELHPFAEAAPESSSPVESPTGTFLPTDESQASLERELRQAARDGDLVTPHLQRFSPLANASEPGNTASRMRRSGTRWR